MAKVLDVTCGSKMMWFNKHHEDVLYIDKRKGVFEAYGRETIIDPDVQADFTDLPFPDESFHLIVMDPPQSKWLGENTILGQKYGQLTKNWKPEIRKGFEESFRVLKINGTLIFKWHEKDVKLSELLEVIPEKPLFGHTSGKHGKTIWLTFMKFQSTNQLIP